MASYAIMSNPIGWAQMRLAGGMKRILAICGIYLGAVLLFNVLIYRGFPEDVPLSTFAQGSLIVMVFIEAGLLVLVGGSAIRKAVHRDFTSDMITSHRTTAMTGYTAAFGYLTGATLTILCLTVINWLACTVLAVLAGDPIIASTAIFLIFGCMAALIWTFTLLVALATRGSTSIVSWLVGVSIVAMQLPPKTFILHPGLGLLLGFTTLSNLSTAATTGVIDHSIFASMFAQVVLALIFYLACSRKYLRDDVTAFNPPLAYTMLAVCTLISAVALRFWSTITPTIGGMIMGTVGTQDLPLQSVVTLAGLALVAMLPIANAARNSAAWARRKAKDPDFTAPRPRPYLEAPIIGTLVVFVILVLVVGNKARGIPAMQSAHDGLRAMGQVIAVFLLSGLTLAGLLRFNYAAVPKAVWVLFVFLVLFWAVPPLVDFSLEMFYERAELEPKSWVFGCSPISTWILVLTDRAQGPILPGLLVQASLAAGALVLARKAKY